MKLPHQHLIKVKLDQLKPTQMAIGFAEVEKKMDEWAKLGKKAKKELIESHWFPSVIGPGGDYYIVDHHHLGMAMHLDKQEYAFLIILKDLSWLSHDLFWKFMEFHQWVHPYDQRGNRSDFKKLPKAVHLLKDDPYRSVAGIVRDQGGFAKDLTPFNEFLWADFFRHRIGASKLKKSFDVAVDQAMELAKTQEASYLPGWIGQKL